MKKFFLNLILLFLFIVCPETIIADVVKDDEVGTYTNDFNTNTGLATSSQMGIDISSGSLKLKKMTEQGSLHLNFIVQVML